MRRIFLGMVLSILSSVVVCAQNATYQGFINQNGTPVNGTYDISLELYDAPTGGQWFSTSNAFNVTVVNGIFTSPHIFGSGSLNGPRWVEVKIRPSGTTTWTNLLPRQELTYTPLAINALTLSGINSEGFIRNSSTQQTSTSFNISGTGTATVLNAATQFNLNGQRMMSAAGDKNTLVGLGAGNSNTTGIENAFFGRLAGENTTTGSGNSFFGYIAGRNNISGSYNSIFGSSVTVFTPSGTGSFNSFFGHRSGEGNVSGSSNSFYGTGSGINNVSGSDNTYIGHDAGAGTDAATRSTAVGAGAKVAPFDVTNATAIGANAQVAQSNSIVLGSINGVNGATADTSVGIGITTPDARLSVVAKSTNSGNNTASFSAPNIGAFASHVHFGTTGDWYVRSAAATGKVVLQDTGGNVGIGTPTTESKLHVHGSSEILSTGAGGGLKFRDRGSSSSADDWTWYSTGNVARFWRAGTGDVIGITTSGNVGIGNTNPQERLNVNGNVALLLSTGGSTAVCQVTFNFRLATCGSSIRYKTDVADFPRGLDLVRRLRPVSFTWKQSSEADFGLIAEEVGVVEPLLVTRNKDGEVEGVKYDRVAVVAVNAIKEQQAHVEQLESALRSYENRIAQQEQQILEMKKALCELNPAATFCKP